MRKKEKKKKNKRRHSVEVQKRQSERPPIRKREDGKDIRKKVERGLKRK